MRIVLLLVLSLLSREVVSAAEWFGYGGPGGNRVFRDATPPTKFDQAKDTRWVVPLPSWGHGSPLAVGGRVFVLCETGPDNLFPLLLCIDADSGKVLWQREIDHLPAITDDPARQEDLRRRVRAHFDRESELISAFVKEGGKSPQIDKAHEQEMRRLYDEMGLIRDKFRRGPYSKGFECMGEAFGTPVSDGNNVFVATYWGGFACFDFDGNRKWLAYSRGNRWTWCNPGRSPILYGNQLIYNGGGTVRALDKRTGKLLWKQEDPPNAYSIVTPAVITVGGKDVLLAAGPAAYLLPEGKPLKVEGWVSEGMQILVKHDEPDVAFFCGSGEHCGWINKGDTEIQPPAAFRFTLEGETLKGRVLWHGGDLGGRAAWGGTSPWMVYDQGRFYHVGGAIVEATTGKVLAGSFERFKNAVPPTRHMLAIAGGHVFGLLTAAKAGNDPKATLSVFTLDGQRVADNSLTRPPTTPQQKRMMNYVTGNEDWGGFSYGATFTFEKDRIYIRSMLHLICIGK